MGIITSLMQCCLLLLFCSSTFLSCIYTQPPVTDVLAWTSMKGTAKCVKHCDLQNSVNQLDLERAHHFWDTPESISSSVSTSLPQSMQALLCVCMRCLSLPLSKFARGGFDLLNVDLLMVHNCVYWQFIAFFSLQCMYWTVSHRMTP